MSRSSFGVQLHDQLDVELSLSNYVDLCEFGKATIESDTVTSREGGATRGLRAKK